MDSGQGCTIWCYGLARTRWRADATAQSHSLAAGSLAAGLNTIKPPASSRRWLRGEGKTQSLLTQMSTSMLNAFSSATGMLKANNRDESGVLEERDCERASKKSISALSVLGPGSDLAARDGGRDNLR
ncbi:unnamed protein product [Protopolystoma xenopodis]|uniref:Uncharacterized protein n=1 Tax=Protopolystoma xenopodis TaxID=117903 RepID=A0A3S4ZCP6_9PLAT|nr:unnamed protein product [Protopolystoma xenopodis]